MSVFYLKSFFFLAVSSIALACIVPSEYNRIYNSVAMVIYILEVIFFLKFKRKDNYCDFDVIFLLIFGISAFAYPVFFYIPSDPFIYFFNLPFDINSISKAVSLSLIAATSYMVGGLCKIKTLSNCSENRKNELVKNNTLIIIIALGILMFVLLGGIGQLKSTYNKDFETTASGGVMQIMAILQACFIATIGAELYNKQLNCNYHFNKFLLIEILLFTILMLYVGNRTYAMIISLPLICYYTIIRHKIKFYQLCLLLPFAFIFMWTIQVSRTGRSIEGQTVEAVSFFPDVVIPCRSNYLVYEVVEQKGFTYGESMSGGIIGVVPSLERILKSTINLDSNKIGSAFLFTEYSYGEIGKGVTGLGTMLQADAYLSFGIIGVVLIFGCIGYTISRCLYGVSENRYFLIVVFMTLMGHSIFWIRAEATYPIKTLVWALIIAYFNKRWKIR